MFRLFYHDCDSSSRITRVCIESVYIICFTFVLEDCVFRYNLKAEMEMNVQYNFSFHLTNCVCNFIALYKMSFSPVCSNICQIQDGKK